MKITDVKISNETMGKKLLCTEVIPYYAYADGKKTDAVAGYRYTIVMQEKGFDKIFIKIEGEKQIEIRDAGYVPVELIGLELFIYWLNGEYAVGARAKGIKPSGDKKTI